MSDDASGSLTPIGGAGGLAVVGGVVCCMGLKLLGGAVLFSGLAAAVGITTDQMTFLVGGVGGLFLAAFLLGYRRVDDLPRFG